MSMSTIHYLNIIKERWRTVIAVGLLVALLAMGASVAMPDLYRSSVQIVVVQKFGYPVDIYTATKSTQYVSMVIKNIIYSRSVMDAVIMSTSGFKGTWNAIPEKRKSRWESRVKSRVLSDTGIVTIEAYDEDARQAERLVSSITGNLIANTQQYIGGSGEVVIKVLDNPVTSSGPVTPNILLNTIAGLLVGLLLGIGWSVVVPHGRAHAAARSIVHEVKSIGKKGHDFWKTKHLMA